jgi:hypothetical protein
MMRHFIIPSAAAGMLALSACASDVTNYPSLARRDVERAPPAPVASPSQSPDPGPDAELSAKLAGLVASARGAHQRFTAARDSAERTIAGGSGAKPGSETWAVASIALASLESARSDGMIALAELDALHVADSITHFDSASGDAQAIAVARSRVIALISEQDRALAALRARMMQ